MMFGGGGDGEVLGGMGVMRAAAVLSPKSQAAMQAQAQWGEQETREFIAIRAEAEMERDRITAGNASKSSKRSKTTTLWELVSARMGERGYKRTPEQCKCKWKNLLNRYKGKETADPENGRQCPFFEELHAVFTEREKHMQRLLAESEAGSSQSKKRVKRLTGDRSSDEFSDGDDEDEDDSEAERPARSNPRRRKVEGLTMDKSLKAATNTGTVSFSTSGSTRELLKDFFQQQHRMEMQWREIMERRVQERLLFEQEWRETMVKLERDRLMSEQIWREREEQRRMRDETRAERRDALLTTLLNKLIHEKNL
ncbi:trihelix transcription factor GT-3b-like [Corylus avellana]|uniref:trihelix transcription factor GT-3b-like n=1 Tax=Corylus avellana TaxID=13451 RepID=UPI001E204FBC|nr:trihelix transcription factor GT-3b-like [Corylus avellana]